jgi:8-oxo-dGTP pyrophosphatase MutT (NUDIX family)
MKHSIHEHLTWKEVSRKRAYKTPIFDLFKIERESSTGKRGSFVILESPDWVNVIPITADEEGRECFLMVRQYRQGGQCLTLEFPGGLIDPGETPEQAAVRELREETGYEAEKIFLAGRINPNPAFMSNCCSTYIAQGLRRTSEQDLDENELVDYELVPVDDLVRDMGTGEHTHAIMVVALFWYEKWKMGFVHPGE